MKSCPNIQDRLGTARGRAARRQRLALWAPGWLRPGPVPAMLAAAFITGCSAAGDNPFTLLADPGKYEYHSCEQIGAQRRLLTTREQELKSLMTRADRDAGGMLVNVLAYKADHVAATEELKVLEATARAKNCDTPATWRSNSAIR